jgi:small-conductance mechanosensitive channel
VSTFFSVAGAVGVAIMLVSVSLIAFLVAGAIFGVGAGIYKLRDVVSS